MRVAVFPGTFDPVTNGHVELVQRALRLFDQVVIALPDVSGSKKPIFSTSERIAMLESVFQDSPAVCIRTFSGLLVDFVQAQGACAVIRGVRSGIDFDYEQQMGNLNRQMCPQVETVLLLASEKNRCIASSYVREIASLGGYVDGFVPAVVAKALREKFSKYQ